MILTKRKYTFVDLIRLSFQFAPWHTAARFLITVVGNLIPTLTVVMTASFIDTAILVATGDAPLSRAILYIVFVIALPIYNRLHVAIRNFINISYDNRLRSRAKTEITERRALLSYHYIENQETRDLIERVGTEIVVKITKMLEDVLGLLGLVVRLFGLAGILLAQVPWAVPILLVLCLPILWIGYRGGKQVYDAKRDTTKLDRAAKNFSEVLFSRENIDERTIFDYEPAVNRRYSEAFEKSRLHQKKVDKKNFIAMKSGSVLLVLLTGAMSVPLLFETIAGRMSVGIFISLVPAFQDFGQYLSWSLTQQMRNIKEHLEYLADLTKMMELEGTEGALDLPAQAEAFESLEFQHVSFRYPGTEPYILKDMSFRIEKGRHYAVVGVNGAGKTTLTKLITGLYDQYEGTILVNGRDLRTFSGAQLKSLCAVVYQDFARYNLTLGENILLGDARGLEQEYDRLAPDGIELDLAGHLSDTDAGRRLKQAADLLELTEAAEKLARGFDTPLGKIKQDGMDLSGGQWQRVAMARAVVSPAGLKILDEPTAALDPISESNIYRRFEAIIGGSTTIFISHRLGSTKLADTIFVVEDGRIGEAGTHEELMAREGQYAQMYRSQAEWYQEQAG